MIYQPKWSDKPLHYRCSWETYFKLKSLKRWYYQTLHDVGCWKRWARKRKYKYLYREPAVCEVFVNDMWQGMLIHLATASNQKILQHFELARMPSETEVAEFPADVVRWIDRMYEETCTWYEDHRGEFDPLTIHKAVKRLQTDEPTVPLSEVFEKLG
jgi:hypothetical protein